MDSQCSIHYSFGKNNLLVHRNTLCTKELRNMWVLNRACSPYSTEEIIIDDHCMKPVFHEQLVLHSLFNNENSPINCGIKRLRVNGTVEAEWVRVPVPKVMGSTLNNALSTQGLIVGSRDSGSMAQLRQNEYLRSWVQISTMLNNKYELIDQGKITLNIE